MGRKWLFHRADLQRLLGRPVAAPLADGLESLSARNHLRATVESVHVDGVMAANDAMALGALQVLQQRGWRVPRDLAVTGFDDTEDGRFSWPPLTTVRQAADVQGRQAAQLLLDRLCGAISVPNVIVPSALIQPRRRLNGPRIGK